MVHVSDDLIHNLHVIYEGASRRNSSKIVRHSNVPLVRTAPYIVCFRIVFGGENYEIQVKEAIDNYRP